MSKSKQFCVLGLGRFGLSVAKTLSDNGFDVLAVDKNPEFVQIASEFVTHAVKADVTDEHSMRALGIGNLDVVIVAIGSSLEASVMATVIAKDLGNKYVISKAQDDQQKRILERIGADRVIFPEREMGVRIANSLMYGNFVEFIELSEEFVIAEIEPLAEWDGKTLAQSGIRNKFGFNIVAIRRHGKVKVVPEASQIINKDDILVVIGENAQIQRFLQTTVNNKG